jgi:VCBS repeat-containing protein
MVNDGAGNSNVATVTITVNAVNDPPVAVNDSYSVNEDTPLAVVSPGLLTNDTDVETIPLTVAIKVTDPLHGTIIAWGGNGSFTYMPNLNWFGVDSFTYKANDGALDSNVATVSITVNAVNDPPVAVNDNYSTNKNTPIAVPTPTGVGVIANDYDVEASPLTAIWVSGPIPAQGTVVLNANGSFLYTPALNFIGIATFTYKVNDGLLDNLLPNATVTITVNNPPVAVNDNYITNEDIPLTVPVAGVLANDTDSDGPAPIAAIKVSDPSNGTVVLSGNGSFTYTPALNYNGTDSFTYKANDGAADSNVATVTITVNAVNDAPVAGDDSYSASQLSVGVPGVVAAPGVLANDTDVDSLVLTAIKVTNPSNGTVVLNADGSFAYTPNPGYSGPDSFTYKANDGALDSNIATVSLTIPPTFDNVIPGGSVPANAPMTFSVDIWSNITGAGLYYKKGGDTSFAASPIALVQSGITWSGSIPAIDVTVGGLFYYVDATTPVTHLYYPTGGASAPASILVHANGGVAYATTPAGSPNIWNMISPNGVPDNPNLIDIVGAGFDATWIAWRWDANEDRWETPIGASKVPNSTDEFTAGKSWFFAKDGNGNPNFAAFSLTSVDVSVPFVIQLKFGWNMVANPFSFPTGWNDTNIIIRYLGNEVSPTQAESNGWVDNRAIWWDPAVNHSVARYSYEDPPFSMMPTSGQWLYSAVGGAELVIKPIAQAPPPIGPEPPPVVAPKKDMTAWEVSLSLQSPVGSDSVTAAVGRATKTTSLHQIKSPGTPLAPYIAFTRDDQVGGASMLSSDVRSIDEELTWSIKATASSEVSLNWSLVNVPDDYMLSLEDQTGKVVNLRQDSAIHLGVGVHSFILKAEKKALIPKATKLLANYPNPFNPETWIPFELSKDTDVAIKIYSSSGQLVRSLELGHKMAGFYSSKDKAAHWDGKNEAGEHVSSGIYFYNIQAGDYKDIRKMVIMK